MRIIPLALVALLMPMVAEARPAPHVRIATAEQKARCKYLGLVSYVNFMGRNRPAGALIGAMRRAEKAGGNALVIVTSSQNDESASVNGEAYDCAADHRHGVTHHVNSVEGFWRLFNASVRSTHVHISAKHMQRYLDEFTFRATYRGSGERDV